MLKHRIAKGTLALALSAALLVSACNAAQIKAYIDLAVQIALQIAMLAGAPKSAADKVTGDLKRVDKLIDDFASAPATAKPGMMAEIDSLLTTSQADLDDILALAQVKDPKVIGAVRASLAIGITAIESIRALAVKHVGPTPAGKAVRAVMPGIVVPKDKILSPGQLKSLYNRTVSDYPQAKLK